jgi:hypothetical protein
MRVAMSEQLPSSRVYPAAILIDSVGSAWNIGDQLWVLRNGSRTNGHATVLLYWNLAIYAKSPDPAKFFHWYKSIGSNKWVDVGAADPDAPPPVQRTLTITGFVPAPSDWITVEATP